MKESHSERSAIHTGLESCGVARENNVEPLTGEGAGRVFSRETYTLRNADAFRVGGRHNRIRRDSEAVPSSARSQTPSTHRSTLRGNREIRVLPERKMPWDVSGSLRTYADDERTREGSAGSRPETGSSAEKGSPKRSPSLASRIFI
jgi:hypothetical protein